MLANLTIAILIAFIQKHEVNSLELVANYKYSKSVSGELTYDYSGNLRHGKLNDNYIITDRGLYPFNYYFPDLMHHAFLTTREYVISYWIFIRAQTSKFWFSYFHTSDYLMFSYDLSSTAILFTTKKNGVFLPDKDISIQIMEGWNFHTTRIYFD